MTQLANIVEALLRAERVTVLTGAGISAESGIPTFREAQTGLWAKYDPTELATPQAFQRNPKLVWEWYEWRRGLVRKAQPNPGHMALMQMEQHFPEFALITQNVDGLHQRAGSQNIIELHGNITRTKCFDENIAVDNWTETGEVPPPCPHCGSHLRPDVVWFGEGLPPGALSEANKAAQGADVFFSIGTSALVQPAASLPIHAHNAGATLIEINPDETHLTSYVDYGLPGPAGEVLADIFALLNS